MRRNTLRYCAQATSCIFARSQASQAAGSERHWVFVPEIGKHEARRGLQPRRLRFVCYRASAKLENVTGGITNPVRLRMPRCLAVHGA